LVFLTAKKSAGHKADLHRFKNPDAACPWPVAGPGSLA